MAVNKKVITCGGKGNLGKFIERDPKIFAAGKPSAQPYDCAADALNHYLLKDEVDALISDAIIPPSKPRPLPPLRHPMPLDTRYSGPFGDVSQILSPPIKTKFQTLVEDLKNTSYSSYWSKPVGQVRDPLPMLPEGLDIYGTTFGMVNKYAERVYDIVLPKTPSCDKTPRSKMPGVQTDRNYCPPFHKDLTYGYRSLLDNRGILAKCCLTNDKILMGAGARTIINTVQSNYQDRTQFRRGKVLAPNNNISQVPEGYSFGRLRAPSNVQECLTFCKLNPNRDLLKKCIAHLNSLRKVLSTRFSHTFYRDFYLELKYYDSDKVGWLPKDQVYELCAQKFIRFDPTFIEPLLTMWQAFDGTKIEYKTFVYILNYKEPTPDMPKIPDMSADCFEYRTTYTEMVKPGQELPKSRMAGIPSGRYLDLNYPITPENCCKAHRSYFPHESDARICLSPSVFSNLQVNHREMYRKCAPEEVRRVFEAAGEKFENDKFNTVWDKATKYHSQGWVCYETFRRALNEYTNNNSDIITPVKTKCEEK